MRLTGFLGLIALAGSIVPGLAGQHEVPAAAATSACTGPFTQVPSPSPGTTQDILNSTATAGAHGQWAVGRQTVSGGELQNLIMFNGGHGWAQVASPDPGTVQNELTAVSASGPADAWAAGWYFTDSSPRIFAPQTLHWDGSSWTLVPFPALHHEIDTGAVGIVDISPDDAWLVGHKLRGGPLIAHWDGTAWSLVTPPAGVGGLRAVAASGPGDVWAAGFEKGLPVRGVTDKPGGASEEKVRVPMELVDNVNGGVVLQWASQAPPPGARFEIQKMAPGSTRFAHLWITTKTIRAFHKKLPAGTYKFRSRMRNPATGATTGWSPTLTVTVS